MDGYLTCPPQLTTAVGKQVSVQHDHKAAEPPAAPKSLRNPLRHHCQSACLAPHSARLKRSSQRERILYAAPQVSAMFRSVLVHGLAANGPTNCSGQACKAQGRRACSKQSLSLTYLTTSHHPTHTPNSNDKCFCEDLVDWCLAARNIRHVILEGLLGLAPKRGAQGAAGEDGADLRTRRCLVDFCRYVVSL